MNKIIDLYKKQEEVINYLIFGVLTTIVNLVVKYLLLFTVLDASNGLQLQIAVVISWIVACTFAYITNRIWVFKSKSKKLVKEFISFIVARLATLVMEMLIMFIFVTVLGLNSDLLVIIWTLVAQVVVVVANYIFSKLFIFKNRGVDNEKISIVIPAYNEEDSLPYLYERLVKLINSIDNYEFEILFINDGSKDKTLELIKEYRKKDNRFSYVNLSRNFGKEVAMLAGIDYATGDAVVFMDADLQDPPELLPELIRYWEEGYDDVYAKRKTREGETFFKKFTSKMYYKVLQKLTNVEIQKDTGDFRLLDRRCVNALKKLRESQRCSKSMFSWIGYKKKEVLFDRESRVAGKTKWNYKKLVDLAIDGITSFTTSPLRISTYISIPTFVALFVYFIYVIVKSFVINQPIQAFQATILIELFFFGIIILLIGIIGEYLGRIFNETKNRPLYFVDEYNDKKEMNE